MCPQLTPSEKSLCVKKGGEDRPCAGYAPSIWSYGYIQSLNSNHHPVDDASDDIKMKELFEAATNQMTSHDKGGAYQLGKIELIDHVLKLGLGRYFETAVSIGLDNLCRRQRSVHENDLYTTALHFRLLRQNGREASQDMFRCHMDQNGRFKTSLCKDIKGLLALYEASYLACDGEETLAEAREFSALHLKNHLSRNLTGKEDSLAVQISYALELPSHRRLQRLEARRYIEEKQYATKNGKHLALIELARLNYNMVQRVLQSDLQDMSRWWEETGLARQLSFARDRLVECFFWAAGLVPEPESRQCRKELTKLAVLVTIIDDVYDVYGTLDELELFTQAVQRWDLNSVRDLPYCMNLCFLALHKTINQMADSIFKEKGVNVVPHLARAWADLCNAFLVEAKWSHEKHIPSFDDYQKTGVVSSSGPMLFLHAYCLSQPISKNTLESFQDDLADIIHSSSMIFRLSNDLVTSRAELARGKSANSVVCYMKDTDASEASATAHMRHLINKSWLKMNCVKSNKSLATKSFAEIFMNLGRICQCVYQYGDAHSAPDTRLKSRIMSLLINPIRPLRD
uniref:Uncharacterized protein n=1 Tax=Kalanchoe fedtschenkoi TaxID=63787 RepID=A0A7N0SXC3_KALFE